MVKNQMAEEIVKHFVCAEDVTGSNPGASIKNLHCANYLVLCAGHVVVSEIATCPLLIGPLQTNQNMPTHHTIDQ